MQMGLSLTKCQTHGTLTCRTQYTSALRPSTQITLLGSYVNLQPARTRDACPHPPMPLMQRFVVIEQ